MSAASNTRLLPTLPQHDAALAQALREVCAIYEARGKDAEKCDVGIGVLLDRTREILRNRPPAATTDAAQGEWVRVPREPTRMMLRAIYIGLPIVHDATERYAAMLAASPQAPESGAIASRDEVAALKSDLSWLAYSGHPRGMDYMTKKMDRVFAILDAAATPQSADPPVAYLIEWSQHNQNMGTAKRAVSFDKCHDDDGRSFPLFLRPSPSATVTEDDDGSR